MKKFMSAIVAVAIMAVMAGSSWAGDATSIKPWGNLKSKNVPYEQPAQDEIFLTSVVNGTNGAINLGWPPEGEANAMYIPATGSLIVEAWGKGGNGACSPSGSANPGGGGGGGAYVQAIADIKALNLSYCTFYFQGDGTTLSCFSDSSPFAKFQALASNGENGKPDGTRGAGGGTAGDNEITSVNGANGKSGANGGSGGASGYKSAPLFARATPFDGTAYGKGGAGAVAQNNGFLGDTCDATEGTGGAIRIRYIRKDN